MRSRYSIIIFSGILISILLTGCETVGIQHGARESAPRHGAGRPIRFLLTFDDGPSVAPDSPTRVILDLLRSNPIQPGIKAIFFIQTRAAKSGGTPEGRELIQREQAENHVLGLHSGTVRGHLNHTTMKPDELQQSIADGIDDITAVAGRPPLFVRPTFWRYNAETLSRYDNNGLNMMLSDVKAYDGGSGFFHFSSLLSSQRHGAMLSELQRVRQRVVRGELPVVNGVIPVVVTFHDTNRFTAGHLEEYIRILVEEAARAGLVLSSKPFYDDRDELQTAALQRAEHRVILETRLPARVSRFFKGS